MPSRNKLARARCLLGWSAFDLGRRQLEGQKMKEHEYSECIVAYNECIANATSVRLHACAKRK